MSRLDAPAPEAAPGAVERVLDAVSRALLAIAIFVGIPAILAVVTFDVASRTFANAPILGANEISSSLLLVVFVGCLPFVSLHNRHIRMDLAYDRFPPGLRRASDVLARLCGAFLYGLLAYEAWHRIGDILRYDEVTQLMQLPLWPLAGVLLACSALVVAIELLRIVWPVRAPSEIAANETSEGD